MPRPDPALLDPARYPFFGEMETRYRDIDSNHHLNNGVIASLLEEGRVRFHRASQFGSISSDPGLSAMVASVSIDYLREGSWPEPLHLHVAIRRIGNSSYELCQLIRQQGQAITFAIATMVCVRSGVPWPIPAEHRDMARKWMLAS